MHTTVLIRNLPFFIQSDLSKYIAAGRINAMIDRVKRVIEISRPDEKNAKYYAALKHGDIMLNQIQNLSRVINI